MAFTHLQVRSGYSLMDSTITIDKLVKKSVELEYESIALTDEAVLYGVVPFYKACVKQGIKPIIGMIIHITDIAEKAERCILLAKNNQGYQDLIKISTFIQQSKEKGIELENIKSLTKDLVCILPVYESILATYLTDTTHDVAATYVNSWQDIFFKEDFYLGVQDHGLTAEQNLEITIKSFHQKYNTPIVAINDVRYLNPEDDNAYECLQAIKNDDIYEDNARGDSVNSNYLRSSSNMQESFSGIFPDAISMTEQIAEKCNVTLDFNERWLPAYPVPNDQDAHDYLKEMCYKNVEERFTEVTQEVTDRLNYELDMIKSMQFSDYFLIVADFINYARENDILVGPGRGSAAGSIVAYVLKITDVDPIKYDLIFERFLNPERVTMPDIDVDFSDHRRDEVIDYVRNKYGKEHVAQIITFGTFGTRSVLRALFKTMDVNEKDVAFILKEIPPNANQSIAASVRSSTSLKEYVMQSQKLKSLFKIATKLEGLPRHISTHAAGIVITDDPLVEHVPLTLSSQTENLTQYPMNDLESLGLLKMDFLGLRNLTFLENIVESVKRQTKKSIDINDLPSEDEQTFKLLQKGKTNGVFQLESEGMKNVLIRLKPTSFEDIVAVNALYRPGPMETIPTYIKRKHKEEAVTFLHPDLAPILDKTYGVLIYQEQIMQIAYKFAGFSLGQADILRRAVSKKDDQLMAEQKENFIAGCLENSYALDIAEELFAWIVKFSNYGFNRSHAVAYSKISYQLAYLKAHYPTHFFRTLLSNAVNQTDKISLYIKEAREMGIDILPPSINTSFAGYSVENKTIRMGLLSINGIGHQIIKEILSARKKDGFTNLFEFCLKVPLKIINRRVIETLILAGTFDESNSNRASLLASIDQAMDQGELFGGLNNQPSILPDRYGISGEYTQIEDFSSLKKLSDEKELLGIYVTDHPLKEYRTDLSEKGYITLAKSHDLANNTTAKTAVIIQEIKKIRTKRGDSMAFLTLSDETGDMEAVLFPELYRDISRKIEEEQMVFISGKVSERNNASQWVINKIEPFDEETLQTNEDIIFIKLTKSNNNHPLSEIKKIEKLFPGEARIIVHDAEKKTTIKLAPTYCLSSSEGSVKKLKQVFGEANVVLKS